MPRQESRDGYPVRSSDKARGGSSTGGREHQYRGGNDIVAAELQTILGGSMAGEEQWFVGVDWATEQHQVCVLEGDGKVVGERQVAHSGDGIADLCMWLDKLSGGRLARVHAAIEMPHGAGGGDAAGARGAGVRDQSQAAGSISGPVYGGRGQGRPARCAGVGGLATHRSAQFSTSPGRGAGGDRVAGNGRA